MQTPKEHLLRNFSEALEHSFHPLSQEAGSVPLEITKSTQDKFGHYQFNSAMRLAKPLGQPPRAIAEKIIENLSKDGMIEKLEIAGPGFVNITLLPSYLSSLVNAIARDERAGIESPATPQRIVIDFSSPNIAKELHVGHLRSTIIGDCLARLFEFKGHDVVRLNHIGDWGTQFGMLIAFMKQDVPEAFQNPEGYALEDLMGWYKQAKAKFDSDENFKTNSQKEVGRLQGGDSSSLKAWEAICSISRQSYLEIYRLLDIEIKDRGESFYNPFLKDVVDELQKKGLVQESDGALCIFMKGFTNREGEPLPLIIRKTDGGYNYATTDLAAIRQRIRDEKADRIIYVTDAGQASHFKMIFQAAEEAGWLDPQKTRVDHVPFGLVLGPDGKKFKTRSGETERLIDLITTAIEKAYSIVSERQSEMAEEEKRHLAEKLGTSSIKYADLSCHRTGDYTFSYDRMLKFEGNTASYLLYSFVRIQGIKKKVGKETEEILNESQAVLSHPSEIALGLHLAQFGETLDQMANDLLPNQLTEYLYQLAEKFNAFFRDCRVEGSEEEGSRLTLIVATERVLKAGLHILGIGTVERM
ncbi:arginine--tRNA ligase [Estrella lausannensis]|uniref:Arginine--tRNA ligase n=1 Tax=Estrella lausannensis TaxID=483423 RepID=A0A0H5DT56_9BACT|nr:arginine--tRNA ligase [Estrella lausannensis]CRX38999.1 Arginyl-tRNA synthetase [Estrella lausannensis]